MRNNGIKNEQEIINALHKKRYVDLPVAWKDIIKFMFGKVDENDTLISWKAKGQTKEDVLVKIKNVTHSMSVKSGNKISVHGEKLSTFCGFLLWLGIKQEYIDILKEYHYGDGTLDGTGEIKYKIQDYKNKMLDKIEIFNKEINKPEYLLRIYNRFLSWGTPLNKSKVDYLFYGTKDGGLIVKMNDFINYLTTMGPIKSNSIHFGRFLYTPASRGLLETNANKVSRYYVNIKWPTALTDIKYYLSKKRQISIDLKF